MSNTYRKAGPKTTIILAAGIDTLELAASQPGIPWPPWLTEAVARYARDPEARFLELPDDQGEFRPVEIKGAAPGGYAILETRDWTLTVPAPTTPKRARLAIRAESLWTLGPERAARAHSCAIRAALAAGDGWASSAAPGWNWLPSRVDLCCDAHGRLIEADQERFVRCARRLSSYRTLDAATAKALNLAERGEGLEVFRYGSKFTGWWVGSPSGVKAAIYLKSLQAEKKAPWIFDVWARHPRYDPIAPVWRVEFRLRRPALKALGLDELDRLFTTRAHLVWRFLCGEWLWLRAPEGPPWVQEGRERRRNLDPWWEGLAEAFAPANLERVGLGYHYAKEELDLRRALPQILGNLAGAMALFERRGLDRLPPVELLDRLQELARVQGIALTDWSANVDRAHKRLKARLPSPDDGDHVPLCVERDFHAPGEAPAV